MLLGRGLCEGPITRSEESYRACVCVSVIDEPHRGGLASVRTSSHVKNLFRLLMVVTGSAQADCFNVCCERHQHTLSKYESVKNSTYPAFLDVTIFPTMSRLMFIFLLLVRERQEGETWEIRSKMTPFGGRKLLLIERVIFFFKTSLQLTT